MSLPQAAAKPRGRYVLDLDRLTAVEPREGMKLRRQGRQQGIEIAHGDELGGRLSDVLGVTVPEK